MTATATALLGFAALTLFLLTWLGLYRTGLVVTGQRKANSFNPSGDDVASFGHRLTRAHANCYENLPAAAAIMLYAIATGQEAITNGLALVFLGARLLQSTTHLISISAPAVTIRFSFFLVQLAILIYWLARLAGLL